MKQIVALFFAIFALCALSCAVMEQEPPGGDEKEGKDLAPKTRAVQLETQDTLRMMRQMQASPYFIMYGQISFRDSVYVMTMSEEDAGSLGISGGVYAYFLKHIVQLNSEYNNEKK